jgi:hypothetical protein
MTARASPSRPVIPRAMESAAPLSSMSLPNTPPSRNSGKKLVMKPPVPRIKVSVHLASSGSPEKAAAKIAAAGAANSNEKPLKARKISKPRLTRMPTSPMVCATTISLCLRVRRPALDRARPWRGRVRVSAPR